jgi:peptidoglycan hydrolase CwlO-like protein
MDPNQIIFVQVAGAVGTVLATWLLFVKIVIPTRNKVKKGLEDLDNFLIDWSGTEKRPGRDRVPGVMERLNEIDGQLKNNGGSSVKDAVDRIEIRVDEINDRTDEIKVRLEDGDKKFDKIEQRLKGLEDKL